MTDDFFEVIDDAETYAHELKAEELKRATEALQRIANKKKNLTKPGIRSLRSMPPLPNRQPKVQAQAPTKQAGSLPRTAPKTELPNALPTKQKQAPAQESVAMTNRLWEARKANMEARQPVTTAPQFISPAPAAPAPKAPQTSGALPRTPKSIIFLMEDGSRKYLDKETDLPALRLIDSTYYVTPSLLAEAVGWKPGPYVERRIKKWVEDFKIVELHQRSLGEPGLSLTNVGLDTVHGKNHGMPSVYPVAFGEDNLHQSIVNTLILRLSKGHNQSLLFDNKHQDFIPGSPVITGRLIDVAGNRATDVVSKFANPAKQLNDMFGYHQNRLLNDPHHPWEANWYQQKVVTGIDALKAEQHKAERHLRIGHIEAEVPVLKDIYSNPESAFLFGVYHQGVYNSSMSPDLVIPRPKTGLQRADGRIEDFRFNHDAVKVFTDVNRTPEFYREMFKLLLSSGMYGRMFAFVDNKILKRALSDAWDIAFDNDIPRQFQGYRDHWLQIRPLPALPAWYRRQDAETRANG